MTISTVYTKYYRQIWLLACLLTCMRFVLNAQDPTEIAPPTPTSASLGEYGAIPVSYYTGVPSISIPIFEIQGRDISLPISLSYHASGIRVSDMASWVGLGWAIHAGGVITQIVMDKNDLGTEREDIPEGTTASDIQQRETILLNLGHTYSKDLMPDNFSYNFCGYSGEFIYDKDENCFIPDNQNFIVTKPTTSAYYFKIVDPNGITYYFEEVETSMTAYSQNENTFSFCLTKIEAPGGIDEITFEYETEDYSSYHRRGCKKYYYNTGTSTVESSWGGHPPGTLVTQHHGKRLKKIVHGETEIVFQKNSNVREDIASGNSYPLEEIQIKYNSELIRSFYFNTDYFLASRTYLDEEHRYDTDPRVFYNKRLRLNYVSEKDEPGDSIKNWGFRYYGDDDPSLNLPNRWSPAQDHWGYYNHALSNDVLTPEHDDVIIDNFFSWLKDYHVCAIYDYNKTTLPYFFSGADRNPNETYCKANTLKSITWPTGGKTEFIFGIHEYTKNLGSTISSETTAGGLRIEKIKNYSSDNTYLHGKEYVYHDGVLMENTDKYFRKVVFDPHSTVPFGDLPISLNCEDEMDLDYTYLEVSSNSNYALAPTGSPVVYKQVDEIAIDESGNDNIGKTEYIYYNPYNFVYDDSKTVLVMYSVYTNESITGYECGGTIIKEEGEGFYWYELISDYIDLYESYGSSHWPYFPVYRDYYKWGKLHYIKKYDINDNPKETVENVYSFNFIKDIKLFRYWLLRGIFDPPINLCEVHAHLHARYYKPVGTSQLDQVIKIDYLTGGSVSKTTSYIYNDKHLPSQKTEGTSTGTIVSTMEYEYETNDTLETKNILTPVSEKKEYNDDTLSEYLRITTHIDYNDYGKPILIKQAKGSNPLEDKMSINYYSTTQNIKSAQKTNNVITSYIWGYDATYPIIKAVNVTSTALDTAAKEINLDTITDPANNSGQRTIINNAYNQLLSNLPEKCEFAIYTYKPLVGMTSQTDQNGITTYYEYDDFGRLIRIRDNDLNILEEYEYNYATPE